MSLDSPAMETSGENMCPRWTVGVFSVKSIGCTARLQETHGCGSWHRDWLTYGGQTLHGGLVGLQVLPPPFTVRVTQLDDEHPQAARAS